MRLLISLFLSLISLPVFAAPWAVNKPKLVVVMVIDQFRADYISRFQSEFQKDGFKALIANGAYFPYGEYDILQSMTAPGHATVLSGAYPYMMGIPINEWYDQARHEEVTSVQDFDSKVVGLAGESKNVGSSPRNFIGSTLGDELKNAGWPTKVVSLALKDRAAVLMGGRRADLAFWFDNKNKKWITSSFYRKDSRLPEWQEKLNGGVDGKCEMDLPCAAQMTADAFKAALVGEKLGQGKGADILAVSFSNHDIAGHRFGPNAPEMKTMTLAEDRAIADMRAAVAKNVPGGLKNVLFVLTGDHGVAPVPEDLKDTGMDSGRINEPKWTRLINETLTKKYGKPKHGEWIGFVDDFNFYLDDENLREAKVDRTKVENEIKQILLAEPAFAHVFTRGEYEARTLPPGMFERRIMKTYYPGRSGNVIGLQKPFYINDGKHKGNHMTGYTFDRMVPIIFSGFGIKGGLYANKAEVVDIAPTLAFLLGVLPPALAEGRVLSEALK